MITSEQNLRQAHADIIAWLFEKSLPVWWEKGVDTTRGGFIEKIGQNGDVIEAPRRTRVVGRQVFSFATAAKMGWSGPALNAVDHGVDFLLSRCLKADNTFHSEVLIDGGIKRPDFDLYDHAFALFGLAAAAGVRDDDQKLAELARDVREAMIAGWKHNEAGFEETKPRTLPLKANPHMHIFEASLAWIDVGPAKGDAGWDKLADEIAELCLAKFIHPESSCLREFFDENWNAIAGDKGRIVEPGHQYEWAWLLKRWGIMRNRLDAIAAARRLVDIAETYGTDAKRGVAFNEIYDDLSICDDTARLWPQTERIKAWLAMAEIAQSPQKRDHAFEMAAIATRGLEKYLITEIPGIWYDKMLSDGTLIPEHAPASSLYHVVCAVFELHAAVERLNGG